ncbi:MAG TPA: Uma2 family endonuclease [Acidimicrobiales bacterium]|nr:Uma2 family endonuclease [Acidimicrobiales bacterium]
MAYAVEAEGGGFSVDDLDWLRDSLGVAHLELDPWGSLIVTPATDEHETAVSLMVDKAVRQLGLPPGCVRVNGLAWKVPGGSGYLNMPDLAVVDPGWRRVGDLHLDPPPLLLVEVGPPSTRTVDRTRKLDDYRLGGAGLYVLVDLPAPGSTTAVTFEVHDFTTDQVMTATGVVDLVVAGRPLRIDLTELATPNT